MVLAVADLESGLAVIGRAPWCLPTPGRARQLPKRTSVGRTAPNPDGLDLHIPERRRCSASTGPASPTAQAGRSSQIARAKMRPFAHAHLKTRAARHRCGVPNERRASFLQSAHEVRAGREGNLLALRISDECAENRLYVGERSCSSLIRARSSETSMI